MGSYGGGREEEPAVHSCHLSRLFLMSNPVSIALLWEANSDSSKFSLHLTCLVKLGSESRLQRAHESPPPLVLPANQGKGTRLEDGGHLKNKILLLP